MKISQAIQNRHSCRRYSSKKISREEITNLLTLANQAPSASNRQNRQFVIIEDEQDRAFLAKMNNQHHFLEAPVCIIVVSREEEFKGGAVQYLQAMEKFGMTHWGAAVDDYESNQKFVEYYKKAATQIFPISDAAAAITTLLLAAVEEGISSCWIGVYDEDETKKRFSIPQNYFIVGCVVLGYEKAANAWKAPRKDIQQLVHWGEWNKEK